MLIYDPALDPYHGAVRLLTLVTAASEQKIDLTLDAARLADYFLVYPYKLHAFRFPDEFKSMRTAVKEAENPYRNASGNRVAFERMRPIFLSTLSGLAAAAIIDDDKVKQGLIRRSHKMLPPELVSAIQHFRQRQSAVGNFVLSKFISIPTNGKDGLKHRSGLLEYRYDPT
ncbi:hypothetical protein O9570_19325 [Achromobacter xylosoxidans]|uniref:Uncharacterized protein n=1 Tax=Alcaligenes xylosoxydans xylosoxydans TaxID=85698 RepID=A0A9X3L0S5_ALCXX|nr:ABC-three component system middle component 5 [Achromobacter xylosoxidans]MCZ8403614.1 hypothetical protein [Achromobacter xylosoxidans]